jgi:hypothetical protein
MRDRSLSVLLHVAASTSFLILGEQAQRLTSDMESSEESVALKGIELTNSAVLERDTYDLHGQQRKMSGGGPRVAVRRTRTIITKKEAALGCPFQPPRRHPRRRRSGHRRCTRRRLRSERRNASPEAQAKPKPIAVSPAIATRRYHQQMRHRAPCVRSASHAKAHNDKAPSHES